MATISPSGSFLDIGVEDVADHRARITYLNTASFILYLFPYLIRRTIRAERLGEGGRYVHLPTDTSPL